MNNRKSVLRVSFKLLALFAAGWVIYVFMAGFFISSETASPQQHRFDLSLMVDDSEKYFSVNGRALLVIKYQNNYSVFWADDPVYGCRLEYKNRLIQAVCIDIEYSLKGYNVERDQPLLKPTYKLINKTHLIVY